MDNVSNKESGNLVNRLVELQALPQFSKSCANFRKVRAKTSNKLISDELDKFEVKLEEEHVRQQ
jgi:hypothetical protein